MRSRFFGTPEVRRAGQVVVAAALIGALLFVVGLLNPTSPRPITTDALGPEHGESVAAYIDRSRATRAAVGGADARWTLVSFDRAVGIDRVRDIARSVRVSEVLFRVPLDRVQTPMVAVAVGASGAALERAGGFAARNVQRRAAPNERAQAILDVSSRRLAAGCECVVGVLVHAGPDEFASLAGAPAVRAVEVLDTDAAYGWFAVRPLLPEHRGTVRPGPDDGPVPGS